MSNIERTGSMNMAAVISIIAAFLFWPAGLVLGYVAREQISRTGEDGRGLTTVAITIGWVMAAITVLFFVIATGSHHHMAR